MNKNGYKIMNISDGRDSVHGDMHVVRANPVIENGLGIYFSSNIGSDTETFFFPANPSLLHRLIGIANSGSLWYPNEDDFIDQRVFDERSGMRIQIHRHIGFYE